MAQVQDAGPSQCSDGYARSMLRLTALAHRLPDDITVCDAVLTEAYRLLGAEWAAVFLLGSGPQGVMLLHQSGDAPSIELTGDAMAHFLAASGVTLHTREDATGIEEHLLRAYGQSWSVCATFVVNPGTHGLLVVGASAGRRPSPLLLDYLGSYAGMLGIMLRGAPVLATESRQDEARRLLQISQQVAATGFSHDALPTAARSIARAMDAGVAIYTVTEGRPQVAAVASREADDQQRTEYKANLLLGASQSPIVAMLDTVAPGDAKSPDAIAIDVDDVEAFASLCELDCARILAAPLVVGGERFGVLATFHPASDRAPESRDLRPALSRIAHCIAPAIHGARLQQELRERIRESEAMRRINQVAWQNPNPDESLDILARSIKVLFNADYVALIEVAAHRATWVYTLGEQAETEVAPVRPVPNAWLRERLDRHEACIVRELGQDPPLPACDFPLLAGERLTSALIVPFRLLDELRGTLVVGYRKRREITSGDVRFASALSQGVTASLMMRRLHAHRGAASQTIDPSLQ